jgi:hypothetical protein
METVRIGSFGISGDYSKVSVLTDEAKALKLELESYFSKTRAQERLEEQRSLLLGDRARSDRIHMRNAAFVREHESLLQSERHLDEMTSMGSEILMSMKSQKSFLKV